MSCNEAETRFYLIDPVLRAKEFDEHWKLRLETLAPVTLVRLKALLAADPIQHPEISHGLLSRRFCSARRQ